MSIVWPLGGRRRCADPIRQLPSKCDSCCYRAPRRHRSGVRHRPPVAPCAALGGRCVDSRDAICLAPLPLCHVGGLTWALAADRFGTTVVLMDNPVPERVLDALDRQRITHAGFVPALMQAILAVPDVAERHYRTLRTILYGASPITEPLLTRLVSAFRCQFFQAYGSAETTATLVVLPTADHDPEGPNKHRLRACGLPAAGRRGSDRRPASGRDVADGETGETGEFWIKAPNVMRGYYGQPQLTAEVITDGWFHSGDVGYRDQAVTYSSVTAPRT